jgi:hypothetical protein
MGSFDSCRKIVVVAFCGLAFLMVALSSAFAGEKRNAISSDQSGCPAILLTNEDYFPALLKAIDEAQSEIFMSIFSFKAGVHKNKTSRQNNFSKRKVSRSISIHRAKQHIQNLL